MANRTNFPKQPGWSENVDNGGAVSIATLVLQRQVVVITNFALLCVLAHLFAHAQAKVTRIVTLAEARPTESDNITVKVKCDRSTLPYSTRRGRIW